MMLQCIGDTTGDGILCIERVIYRASVAVDNDSMFSMSAEEPVEYLPPHIQIALHLYHYLLSFLHRLKELVEHCHVLQVAFFSLRRIGSDHKRSVGRSDCLMTVGAPATPF
jgi:hypothetical protein